MARRIHVDFRKWPDRVHWQFEMEYLGEDAHGLWLWRAPGWAMRRAEDPPVKPKNWAVKLITPGDWWTAMWTAEEPPAVYVDIATPARWRDDRVTMIDLDLDVVRRDGGGIEVHDEDEFEENQVALGYPPHVVARALATTEEIVAAMDAGREPFGNTARAWLQRIPGTEGLLDG